MPLPVRLHAELSQFERRDNLAGKEAPAKDTIELDYGHCGIQGI